MEHKTLEQLKQVSKVHIDEPRHKPMSRRQRLCRWAEVLDNQSQRRLNTFVGTENETPEARDRMRRADSPISVAFSDSILRAEGLQGDTYGEAKRFFGLSDWELHDIVCYCFHGSSIMGRVAASRVRGVMPRETSGGFFTRAWRFLRR